MTLLYAALHARSWSSARQQRVPGVPLFLFRSSFVVTRPHRPDGFLPSPPPALDSVDGFTHRPSEVELQRGARVLSRAGWHLDRQVTSRRPGRDAVRHGRAGPVAVNETKESPEGEVG